MPQNARRQKLEVYGQAGSLKAFFLKGAVIGVADDLLDRLDELYGIVGLLHIANGGYLIMQATDIVSNQYCYETLKKVLRTKELGIENPVDQHSSMVMVSLKPEPIPLNLKVILIGNEAL